MNTKLVRALAIALIALGTVSLNVEAKSSKKQPKNAENAPLIKQLKIAYDAGNFAEFNKVASQMKAGDQFVGYRDIWSFRFFQKAQEKSAGGEDFVWAAQDVIPLLAKYEGQWPAEDLRREWIKQLARNQRWDLFREQRPLILSRVDQSIECADMLYAKSQGQLVREKLDKIITFEKGLSKTCRSLIKSAYESGSISDWDLERRILHLTTSGQIELVPRLLADMQGNAWSTRIEASKVADANSRPEFYLKTLGDFKKSSQLYAAVAMARLAISEPDRASSKLNTLEDQFDETYRQWLWGHIGYRAALVWDNTAYSFFRKSHPSVLSPQQKEWKVRAALLNGDWSAVLVAIQEMDPLLAEQPAWNYWRGRALSNAGRIIEARQSWIKIATPFNFYGKLATEELGETVAPPKRPQPLTNAELTKARNHAGLNRALALYDAGLRQDGFLEFNLQASRMNDRELLAAATWASENELYDRAIAAADRTQLEHDLSLRYLTPFKEDMVEKTREMGLDESWVYGLIRQESRFVTAAKSRVGASGLMQVMPATARYVAKKIGMKGYQDNDIAKLDVNLTLGTSYLKMVLEQHEQSPVLAAAGYNAGPGRPSLWKRRLGPGKSVEGALFTELIPFDETRDYVKNVMSNTVAYSLLLNNTSIPLKQRLGIIYGS